RIVVRTVYSLCMLLVPARPTAPIKIAAIKTCRHLIGLIVEKTFSDSILLWPILILQASPERFVDELLQLSNFFFIRINPLLHQGGDPSAPASLVSQTRDPDTAVLHHDLIGLPVIGHYRWGAVKRIIGISEPLFRGQEVAHVGDHLPFRFRDE